MINNLMIQGQAIMRRLRTKQSLFNQKLTPAEVIILVQDLLKPWGVKTSFEYSDEVSIDEVSVGGFFDSERRRQNIELQYFFNPKQRKIKFVDYQLENFLFLTGQVLQHELIHRYQNAARPEGARGLALYYDVPTKTHKQSRRDEINYLSELDEIDAYAHDIALEICYYYADQDPYKVLKTLQRRRYCVSWSIYKRAFQHSSDWSQVRHRLLAKVYKWIPHITL